MKKIVIAVLVTLILVSCNVTTKVSNNGIPDFYTTLEFWNGGGNMASYTNVSMQIEIVTTEKVIGQSVYFYKYHVFNTEGTVDDWIIDSEALALKYTTK